MTEASTDATLMQLEELAETYHERLREAAEVRAEMNAIIRSAKDKGYSFPKLARASGLSIATIQNIVSGRHLNERHYHRGQH
jgi:cell division inhibitor SulA